MTNEKTLTNGRAAAALLAGGIGAMTLGLMTVLAVASAGIKTALTWMNSVGSLSGKTSVAVIVWLVSWVVIHQLWKNKEVKWGKVMAVAFALLMAGVLMTFPPFFELFHPE
ncbi:MAG: hypothetical protein FD147_1924 [Chloroflexi bacterium]|nr:MAG: hypothetical protein FD147_1924 [Chloroflexota bacterium]MBA4374802.1 hypothetical protein [Anaerolinea sp.]